MERMLPIFYSMSKEMRNIHKDSCTDVSVVQSAIMQEISIQSNPSMQRVAVAVGMDITTFSRQIGTLEKKNYVMKTPFQEDRRINLLALTDEGVKLIALINTSIAEKLEKVLHVMNEFERETVIRSLYTFNEKLSNK